MQANDRGQQQSSSADAEAGGRGRVSATLLALLCAGAGAASVAALSYWSFAEGRRELANRFDHWASERCGQIVNRLQQHMDDLESVGRYIEGSEFVDDTEFNLFVTPLLEESSGLIAVCWAPHVAGSDRAAFEAAIHEGGPGIREPAANGLRSAPERPQYFPIAYVEPPSVQGRLSGLDLMGWDALAPVLQRVRETYQPSVTEEIPVWQDEGPQQAVLVIVPVEMERQEAAAEDAAAPALQGYVVGMLSIARVVDGVLRDTESVGVPFDIWDMSGGGDGHALYRHVARVDGSTTDSVLDRLELTHAHDVLFGGRTWRLVFEPGPSFISRHNPEWPRFVPPLGLCVTALLAMIVYSLGLLRDRAERVATQQGQAIQGILEAIPDFMFRFDKNGVMLEARAPDPELLHGPESSNAGTLASALMPASALAALYPAINEAVLERRIRTVEYRVQTDGGDRLLEARIAPCGEGEVVAIVRDITDRKTAEEQHLMYERQMLQAQKLESLGVLAGGIAHDFNNLLMAILGYADMAQRDTADSANVARCLREVENASLRAADLCRQMLAYAGKGRFIVEDIDLNEVILDTMPLLRASIPEKVNLALCLQPSRAIIRADATQIRQVLMSLVANASEALGDQNGNIRVSTSAMAATHELQETSDPKDAPQTKDYVCLEVFDDGCGMDPETLDRIFEPFFTTKFTGRGLGLAAVQGIVRGHNAQFDVRSTPGYGTTFRIWFPAVATPGTLPSQEDVTYKPAAPLSGGTILLVDDEEPVRTLGTKMLERLGFSVITACDGVEGLDIYERHREEIRAVILDLTMPRMDGEETFRQLQRIRPDVCVILSSGLNEQETVERFLGLGLAAFIQKPYRFAELQRVLGETLGNQETKSPVA